MKANVLFLRGCLPWPASLRGIDRLVAVRPGYSLFIEMVNNDLFNKRGHRATILLGGDLQCVLDTWGKNEVICLLLHRDDII